MTLSPHLAWFIVQTLVTVAILVVGTLAAADLIPRRRERRPVPRPLVTRRQGPEAAPRSRPAQHHGHGRVGTGEAVGSRRRGDHVVHAHAE